MVSSFYLLFAITSMSCLIHISIGSNIVFNSSSPTFMPRLTPNLTMRCGLDDSTSPSSPSSAIVGRDLTQTTDKIQFITSIIISRNNGDDVATINEHFPAKGIADTSNIQVKGDVSGTSGELGYLEVTWSHPIPAKIGEYQCEISALLSSGHSVLLSSTLDLNVSEPSINDLVDFVSHLKEKVTDQEALIQTQAAQIQTQASQIQTQASQILKSGHIEMGTVECHGMTSSSPTKTVSQNFTKPYDVPPKLHVALTSFDVIDRVYSNVVYSNVVYSNVVTPQIHVTPGPVTKQGFTVSCFSTSTLVYKGTLSWMSVPN